MVNQKVLSTQLRRLGCKVFVAGHGVEALDFLKTTPLWHGGTKNTDDTVDIAGDALQSPKPNVDVILMDIEMPVMGGLACTRAIRDLECQGLIRRSQSQHRGIHEGHDRLPIISISANARIEQSNEQKEAGVDDIVTKPFRIPQLMDKMWRLIGHPGDRAGNTQS